MKAPTGDHVSGAKAWAGGQCNNVVAARQPAPNRCIFAGAVLESYCLAMDPNSEELSKLFEKHGRAADLIELRSNHAELKLRAVESIAVQRGGDAGDPSRIRMYTLAYRQVLLHRALLLLEGSLQAANDANPYLMILAIRAFIETVAALGYLHNRLASLAAGNLERAKVDEDIMIQILGTKAPFPAAPPPKQIMTMLDYADKSVSKKILGGSTTEHAMLRESYDHLSEFAHPNFHSNKLAFDLDKSTGRFVFRTHNMPDEAFAIIGYLVLASSFYVGLHDSIDEFLPANKPGDVKPPP
jgi:hypothetical protein